jgi:uncharacterized protein
MAEKIKAEEEPSIEEILDSIRQIISEDEGSDEDDTVDSGDSDDGMEDIDFAALDGADSSALDEMDDDDVFVLTEHVEEVSSAPVIPAAPIVPEPAKITAPPSASEPKIEATPVPFVVDLIDEADETIEDKPEPVVDSVVDKTVKEEIVEAKPKVTPVIDDVSDAAVDSILSAAAENAAFSAMAELARKTAVEHNGVTLEDIVRAELKPLLRTWLDKNLPIVIERLVREELERVSRRVLED